MAPIQEPMRDTLIKRVTELHEGTGVPTVDGKARRLTHLQVWTIDDQIGWYSITVEQMRKGTKIPETIDRLLIDAREHAYGAHRRGLAPRYFLRDYYGSSAHLHTWDLQIEPPISDQGTTAPTPLSDQRNSRDHAWQITDAAIRYAAMALDVGERRTERAMRVLETQQERADARHDKLADRFDKQSEHLEIALDRKVERDIRMANEHLKLRIKGAVADQAVAALPGFAALGHRLLNAKTGVKDAPLNEELEEFFTNLSKLPAEEVQPIIAKVFTSAEDRDKAVLAIQRVRSRANVKVLNAHAAATEDGVTRPVTFTRLSELAQKNEEGRPGLFKD